MINAVRESFHEVFYSLSYFYINKSTIKFYGYKLDTYLTLYKFIKEGFVFYALVGLDKLTLDFVVSSSQKGIEVYPKGIYINILNRTLRDHKKDTIGLTITKVNLPPIKALVFTLYKRATRQYRYL